MTRVRIETPKDLTDAEIKELDSAFLEIQASEVYQRFKARRLGKLLQTPNERYTFAQVESIQNEIEELRKLTGNE